MYNNMEKNIISTILNSGNYRLQDFDNIIQGKTLWTLQRSSEQYDEIVIFIEDIYYMNIQNIINNYILEQYTGNKGISLEYVVFKRNNNNASSIRNTSFNNPFVKNTSLVLIDEKSCDIVYGEGNTYSVKIVELFLKNEKLKTEKTGFFKSPVTNVIILLNILIFGYIAISSRQIWEIDGNTLLTYGAKYSPLIRSGEYYRLFTAMFLHSGLTHIAANMIVLSIFGPLLEKAFGSTKFFVIYIVAGVFGNLASYFFSNGESVGASGAIFGLLGAALVYGITMKDKIGKNFYIIILQMIFIQVISGLTTSNIDNYAHIGGLIGGAMIAYIVENIK